MRHRFVARASAGASSDRTCVADDPHAIFLMRGAEAAALSGVMINYQPQ
jgi:hypothetical protein